MSEKEEKQSIANLTMSQESELNAKAAAQEGFEEKMAFEIYYKMGESRSLVQVAKKVGRSKSGIEKWASDFRWTARIKERERQAAEFLLLQKSAQEEAEVKKKHLTLIDASIGGWAKKLTEGKIRLRSVEDLERLIRMRWDLTSMPDKRVNVMGAAGSAGMIDLRLRNMDRGELQQFLYSTLKSIERITNKDKSIRSSDGSKPQPKMSMDLTVNLTQTPDTEGQGEVIDVGPGSMSQDPLDSLDNLPTFEPIGDLGDLEEPDDF